MAIPIAPLALGALGAYVLTHDELLKPKPRKEWLARFSRWAGPSSVAEEDRVSRTERMVRSVVQDHPALINYDVRVIGQGSSKNNTNVRLTSDLDILVISNSSIWEMAAAGETYRSGFVPIHTNASQQYADFKKLVRGLLREKFQDSGIKEGSKTIKLMSTQSSRVECDVLPCFRLHQYLPRNLWTNNIPTYIQGVLFVSSDGDEIHSFPERHLENGKQKNLRTNYRYKQIVRVIKKLRNILKENMTFLSSSELPSSFQIESLVFNVPDHILMWGDLFDGVIGALNWIGVQLETAEACNRLLVPSEMSFILTHWNDSFWEHGSNGPEDVIVCRDFIKSIGDQLIAVP